MKPVHLCTEPWCDKTRSCTTTDKCPDHGGGPRPPKDHGAPSAQSKASHTPGPWRAGFYRNWWNIGPDKALDGAQLAGIKTIATVHAQADAIAADEETAERMFAEAKANAKLIAAAPALADALEELIGTPDGYHREHAEFVARDALRLAGRPS